MDGLHMLFTRRSIRSFKTDPVGDAIVADIVRAGQLAATGRNVQPWEFVVVRSPEVRAQIAAVTENGKFIETAPVCIAVLCQDTKYYLEDGSAAAENILLAARYHGLGSCWVAGDKKDYAPAIRDLCRAPSTLKLICLIAVGYPESTKLFREKSIRNPQYSTI